MSSSAQYAVTPKIGVGTVTTGDASRTAPSSANVAYVFPSGPNGSRVDHINLEGIGATIASALRLFLVPGNVGAAITSITFSGTTATVTTATNHGLSTGAFVTMQNVFPANYNVSNVSIIVTALNQYTYVMGSAPTINAVIGASSNYISNPASPTFSLWQEILVQAIPSPGATQAVFSSNVSSYGQPASMPLWLPAGWSLRATINDTQTASGVNVIANGGDF